MVPAVVFSDPQVASVGLTASAARQRDIDVEVLDYDVAELLHSATTAIVAKVPLETLWHMVP